MSRRGRKPRKARKPGHIYKPIPRDERPDQKWQPMENGHLGTGPAADAMRAEPGFVGIFVNDRYQVTMREVPAPYIGEGATVDWLCIRRRDSGAVHDWRDLQRIKNDLCGPEREACELYPAESRLVDTANQYHLWVMPEGVTMPFGYAEREVSDRPCGANRNRAFAEPPGDLNAREDIPEHPDDVDPEAPPTTPMRAGGES